MAQPFARSEYRIIAEVKLINENFILWSEEFDPQIEECKPRGTILSVVIHGRFTIASISPFSTKN